ncbi:MAG: pyruvate carboxylase, partial [Flavobacteriaceae bacterium]
VLKEKKPYSNRPNAHLKPIDFDLEYKQFQKKFQKGFTRPIEFEDFLSYCLYPKVFEQAHDKHKLYGSLSHLPTKNFFYGVQSDEEMQVELQPGKTIMVKLLSISHPNENGIRLVFFKVNGENRYVEIADNSLNIKKEEHIKADLEDSNQMGAPLQGSLYKVLVKKGQKIKENDPLFIIEAMKMETTVVATNSGTIKSITLNSGAMVKQDDLILSIE